MKKFKKVMSILLACMLLVSVSGCGKEATTDVKDDEEVKKIEEVKQEEKVVEEKKEEQIEIKFISNLPDRNSGQGQLEQKLIDSYMAEYPNVTIKVEALQDEPYKQKFQAYVASDQLPDVFMTWGQPSFFGPIMKMGYAAELNENDYEDYGFFDGALDGFSNDGKLYGLPRNTDLMALYYNEALFVDNGIKVPTNYSELKEAIIAFREKSIAPLAMDGKDQWVLNIFYQDLLVKESGDQKLALKAVNQKEKFAENENFALACKDMKELIDLGVFQDSFIAADYGAAQNIFAQEKAAMYYMGAWEVGMATNESFSESFRNNLKVMAFPGMKDGKGKSTDYLAWNGGGYAVSANSKVKDESIKLLNYMMRPDNWTKNAWQNGLVVPAQSYSEYYTGTETELQIEISDILNAATSFSGTPWNDLGNGQFKTDSQVYIQEFAAGIKTTEEFLEACDESASKIGK